MTISFDKENICNGTYQFIDNLKDENSFIGYPNVDTQYDFKRNSWIVMNCYLKGEAV